MGVCLQMPVYVEPEVHQVSSSIALTLFFLRQDLPLNQELSDWVGHRTPGILHCPFPYH